MLIIGHKGSAGLATGNTLEAVQVALELGVDIIEIDLHITKDGVIILHHDKKINSQNISSSNFKSLFAKNNKLTTLEQIIKLVKNKSKLLLDIKPGQDPEPIISLIAKYKKVDFIVTSFDVKILQYIHNDSPDIELAVLDRWSGVRASYRARKFGTKTIIMNHRWLWSGFIKSMSRSGYNLFTYTLNNPDKAQRWASVGLAGVITDYPDRFLG